MSRAAVRGQSPENGASRRRLARRLALALLSAALAVGGLEVGARAYFALTLGGRSTAFDADLGWRPLPNVRKHAPYWGGDEPAWTNSRGFRDAEHAFEKPAGVVRVLALGDSFTFGVDVDYGQRFSELLEQWIDGLEVVNLGVNAFGPANELRALEVEGLRYAPDVVLLLVFLGNDLDDVRHVKKSSWPNPYYRLDGDRLELVPPRWSLALRLRTSSYVGEGLMRLLDRSPPTVCAPEWVHADSVPLFAALVARMAQVSAAGGARFLAVLTYPAERLGGAPSEREVRARAALEAKGIDVLDTFDLFAVCDPAGEALFVQRPQWHWSPHGHEVVARALQGALLERGWLR